MLKGFSEKGEIKNIKIDEEGKICTEISGTTSSNIINDESTPVPVKVVDGVDIPTEIEINNEEANPVPVNVVNQVEMPTEIRVNNDLIPVQIKREETTLLADIKTVGTENITCFQDVGVKQFLVHNTYFDKDITFILPTDAVSEGYRYMACVERESTALVGGVGTVETSIYEIIFSNESFFVRQLSDGKHYLCVPETATCYSKTEALRHDQEANDIYNYSTEAITSFSSVAHTSYDRAYLNALENVNFEYTSHSILNEVEEIVYKSNNTKKITSVDIANYSETANITVTACELEAIIGSNIATTLPINKELENIYLSSTEEDTKVQVIVKGVE